MSFIEAKMHKIIKILTNFFCSFQFQGREPATYIRTMVGKASFGLFLVYCGVYYFKYCQNVSDNYCDQQTICFIKNLFIYFSRATKTRLWLCADKRLVEMSKHWRMNTILLKRFFVDINVVDFVLFLISIFILISND